MTSESKESKETPRLTITDEKGNIWVMDETYDGLKKAYDGWHKEKERLRVKARKSYVPKPRVVQKPAEVVQVVAVAPVEPVAPVAPVTPVARPRRKPVKNSDESVQTLEEKVENMDI